MHPAEGAPTLEPALGSSVISSRKRFSTKEHSGWPRLTLARENPADLAIELTNALPRPSVDGVELVSTIEAPEQIGLAHVRWVSSGRH